MENQNGNHSPETVTLPSDLKTIVDSMTTRLNAAIQEEMILSQQAAQDIQTYKGSLIQELNDRLQAFVAEKNMQVGIKRGQIEEAGEFLAKLAGVTSLEPLPAPQPLVAEPIGEHVESEQSISEVLHGSAALKSILEIVKSPSEEA